MKANKTLSIQGTPTLTVGEVRTFINSVGPNHDDETIHITSERFNHPTDPGYDSMSVTFEEEI